MFTASAVPRRRRKDGTIPGYGGHKGLPIYAHSAVTPNAALVALARKVVDLFPELVA